MPKKEAKKIDFNFLLPKYLVTVSTDSETDRIPENKKLSWEDLKNIKQKIQELNIKI